MEDLISRQAAIDALNEYFARIGKLKRRGLTKGEKAISLDTVEAIKNLPPVEAIPVSWIEAKIELVNDLPGVSMLKMKAADWVDLVKQWRAEQRNPEVDHDAQIRELAEEMQKHGVHKPTVDSSTAETTETTAETTVPSTNDWIPVEREIIHCKDCKHWRDDHTCHEHSLVSPMCANEYCSRAERRTDERFDRQTGGD